MTSGSPRKYRKNLFRVPLAGDDMAGDAVRAPSRSVEVMGLEPTASTLRT